jgi:hypothetical protein
MANLLQRRLQAIEPLGANYHPLAIAMARAAVFAEVAAEGTTWTSVRRPVIST